jgi:hypothetical protein
LVERHLNVKCFRLQLFNNLSNSDLIAIAEAGELNNFCTALTLDLHSKTNEKDTTYEA